MKKDDVVKIVNNTMDESGIRSSARTAVIEYIKEALTIAESPNDIFGGNSFWEIPKLGKEKLRDYTIYKLISIICDDKIGELYDTLSDMKWRITMLEEALKDKKK